MEDDERRPDDDGDDDPLRRYLAEVASVPLLTRDEEVRLAQAAEAGDQDARRRLLESNLRLVVTIARRYDGQGLRLADVIQVGNIGLTRAADHYDWRKGIKFSTYATWWIRRSITEALNDPGEP